MFEAHVLHLLRKYLGEYVHGLSTEALRISVWKGDVVLKDLRLKAEALNALKLPVTVNAGFVGTITLKVPWKSLGKEPVIVLIDRVFILAHPSPDGQSHKEEDRDKIFQAKLQHIEEAELATLEAATRGSKAESLPTGNSWLGSLIATIIGNLKITISNVHIRYEDTISNPGHPFCSGITLAKLAAVTMDEYGNETFDTSGALDKLRKSLHLQRLALYHDSDSNPWKLKKKWEDLSPVEWIEIFADGIDAVDGDQSYSSWAMNRKYLVSPINGVLKYHRLGKQERNDPETPFEKASLVLGDVSLTILEAQYYDGILLLEALSKYKTRIEVSHLRPIVPISKNSCLWWRYAVQATLQQKKMCHKLSWERIKHLCQLRRHYVQLYASSLQHSTKNNNPELREIEKDLDSKVIILWRLLAHARVESVKSKEVSQQRRSSKSWWPFGWNSSEDVISEDPGGSSLVEEKLTREEWKAINKMLSYEVDDDVTLLPGKDMQTMIQFLVDISVGQAAARIVSINQTEILCGRFEQLNVTTKFYHKSIHCDVLLRFCGLSAPEGTLAQSVSSEEKINALAANFVHLPAGENVDWRLSATIAPCHVTIFMKSYERFLEFMKRSNAVSPALALETATALQMKIEKVTRKAQEQFQMVLEEKNRFALDIDFDAPKVSIPLGDCLQISRPGYFLLDFGHFTLQTREDEHDEQRQSLYSRFHISGKDIAAFFKDGSLEEGDSVLHFFDAQPSSDTSTDDSSFYSLIDRCRMSVIVDQIKVPHPSYPSTRVSIQVPNLGIHFSPARYCRIYDLLDIFYSSTESFEEDTGGDTQSGLVPWCPADLTSDARVLVWKGIGNSLAKWQPCYLILSGLYLYVLESASSQFYQRCCSMSGRHAFEISPASVGGSLFSIAISVRGSDIQKALESSSTLVIEFRDDAQKSMWLRKLVQASYRASAPPTIDIFGKARNGSESHSSSNNLGTPDLVINGALVETKLSLYGRVDRNSECDGERLILELLANGGKVHLVRSVADLTAKIKLHSLKIGDGLQGHISTSQHYLACSMLATGTSFCALNCKQDGAQKILSEEDDIFRDALQDFMFIPDQSFDSESDGMVTNTRWSSIQEKKCHAEMTSVDGDHENSKIRAKSTSSDVFYEAEDIGSSDFVDVIFIMRYPDSPLYDGTDTHMSVRMSKIDFFCNRPTVVALLELGWDLSLVNSRSKAANDKYGSTVDTSHIGEKTGEGGSSIIKGLLGHGKKRIVFYLSMDMDSVSVFLNKEDGSQLAMFVQERFLFELKVHPSSISVDGTLGNMKLYDLSVEPNHYWGCLCDIRDQNVESLIKFSFQSYYAEDDDYVGHDYSLSGHLSAVRIVFLYRFVQEIMAYFMELATPHTEEVIKFVDKVGGFEWLIHKYEVDGAAAIKLDLSLDTPLIIVPYFTRSKDFMQLDLGQLRVSNNFVWYGGNAKDPSAVHLDIIRAEIQGISMGVGIDGSLGKPVIREAQGFEIFVRRSLRDVFRKVPTVSVEVKIGLLHFVMSDKEYKIIMDCAYTNISEEPNIPPSFRVNSSSSKDSIRLLAEKVNVNSQILLSRTVGIVCVDIQQAKLELCNGLDEETPLAQIALEGLWVSYRYTSLSETDLYVTIPRFTVLDIRPDTKPEMRLMLGVSSDVPKQGRSSYHSDRSYHTTEMDMPSLTMLVMDYRWRSSSQSFVIRMQQPRMLVVLDFLLAVVEFFVPALRSITGREEALNPKNDPVVRDDNIILVEPVHMQKNEVIVLSPRRQLIVDGPGTNEIIYDGCGGSIHLSKCEVNDCQVSELKPLIIIGNGKRLRFRNVKIKNSAMLLKCTHLGSNSSYSVCEEDNVELSLVNFASNTGHIDTDEDHISIKDKGSTKQDSHELQTQSQSFSFEAQVISPELTFYDSTKVSLDDSLFTEKQLRVRMDVSFMFAAKENDVWVRSLLKDLTVEAGSGLIVLDPVDISGGYTSVKDKTNMSVISSDICIHLSLTVASLLLQLQQQASAALQFGNANPIAACTNFRRLWISQKGSVPGHNLTFWRPQAPSNYAILGDCVTSRPIPPSQVVMAVSNAYGRVKKPVGFKFIGFLSDIQGLDDGKPLSTTEHSLWEPMAPPGYIAVGCVVHPGSEVPPNHIVYCIRADLVTSGKIVDCILAIPPNQRMLTGFSIWRIENAVGTFCAHAGLDCPIKAKTFDLHHILLHNHDDDCSLTKKSNSSDPKYFNRDQTGNDPGANISGWDVLRSFSKSSNCYMSVPHFERIWWDKGCELRRPISIWRPSSRPGYAILGDCVVDGLEPPSLGVIFKCDSGISAKPVQFTRVAQIIRKGHDDAFFWYPIAPPGYASLGCLVTKTDQVPNKDLICCPRMDLVNQASLSEIPICKSSSRGCNWSIWKVENQASTFLARLDLKRPSSRLAFTLSDYVKPRARQNISAEMKFGSVSLTVLDSMMAPLCDMTVTNTSLATHGRPEAMNAVLICSVAASTFNRQLEAWEPLVEPFDGIFKLETYETNGETSAKIGKRVRVAATSTVDVNISASNLETLTESIISWRTQMDLEKKSTKKNEECCDDLVPDDDSAFSALEKNDFNKVVLENRLGCDLYLRKVEQNSETIQPLEHGNHATVSIPPPRFSDRLNIVSDSKEARSYIAVWIFQAQRLPILDDGNGHDFFCALRLVTDSHVSDRHKLFPQSARTRSIKPLMSKVDNLEKGAAKWNELFIFEVPEKGSANLELEVTNLSSKAGKGEIIGALSIPIRNKAGSLRRIGSVRMLLELGQNKELSSYSLKRRGEHSAENQDCGNLLMSTYFIERSTILDLQREVYDTVGTEGEIGFWVGLSRKGLWESFGSILAFSVTPKLLNGKYFAFEVSLKNGKKHAVFRPLATLINNTDVKLEVSVCPSSVLVGSHGDMNNCLFVTEEIFENQRCQPSGSNKKMAGPQGTDPGRWSMRDLSYSSNSQDIFDISLPPGWKWTSAWAIDKSGSVDSDGWAYGTDFQSMRWPPVSNNSYLSLSSDCVRRRRWVRTRQAKKGFDDMRDVFAIIEPGSSAVLPWRSFDVDLDFCLQVRPCDKSTGVPYAWSQTFGLTAATADVANDEIQYLLCGQSPMKYGNVSTFTSAFKLNQLQKRDVLLLCNSIVGPMQPFWLSAVTDASVLHTDINVPVYDWKITLGSPFRLENKLPCQAQYSIWEKTLQGNIIERQHGVLSPESSVFVYSADLRRPIYLKFYVQDDWVLEKDAVLIMDLSALEHASSFWMVHKESNRRLRLSIERDIGGSIAAPKAIRIFVPYWIKNDSPIALSYRIVEIEPSNSGESDSPYITKAVKSAKLALKHSSSTLKNSSSSLKHSSSSLGAKFPSSKRNIQLLEAIEEPTPLCVMLSPFDYMSHGGILQFTSRSESCLSPRIAIAIAAFHSENYGPGISLYELENKERIDVKAFTPSGTYYRLSATLIMASDRTKVVHFQPHTLIFNRVGCSIFIKQFGTEHSEWFHPLDLPKLFEWHLGNELLELRVEGYHWSTPFSMEIEGVMNIPLRNEISNELMFLRAEVRNGAKNSCYEIILRRATFSSPYRIENRSMFLPVRFRQANGFENSWQFLPPNASTSFCWEDLGRQQLLEVLVNGNDPSKSEKFNIDDVKDYEPMEADNGPVKCIHVAIVQDGKTKICRISDWMPVNESLSSKTNRLPPPSPSQRSYFDDTALESELHVIFELADLGVSIIDRMPEEILYFSMQNLLVSYSSGLGSGVSRLKLRVLGLQVDNQLPFTPMPVLFRPQRSGLTMDQPDYILKLSLTMQKTNSLNLHIYPYVGVQGPDNSAFLINIHEPIIWRLHEMIQQAKLSRIYGSQSSAVSIDPTIQIGLLNISEVRFKVSMTMSPAQRPGGVLGFWSSLMTALGNMENMLVKINQRSHEDICMRQSALVSNAMTNIQKDLLSQPLRLLSGVDILGNASSALGHMSKGVAALSMDKKFIQSRQKQESKGVEDIGDVIREGGGALAKGFFRGVTGILTKPLEGAKSSGVEGFVQGVGKGIIGAAAQPVSGVLDLLSKTTEGANAVRMKIASAITSEEQLLRKRLPRAIGGDNLLKPFDEYRATGQAILQLAESGTFLGQVDLFKVRGKFALSDAYEDHFLLPNGKILLVTHRRVLLLQQPSNTVGQKKFSPSRDPCSVLWDVLWDNLVTMELILGKKEPQNSPPSFIMFYLVTSTESRENVRVVKCHKDCSQAIDIYNSAEKARSTYGPNRSKELQRKVTKPYSPVTNTASAQELPKEVYSIPVIQEVPSSLLSTTSTFGAVLDQH